MKVNVIDYSTGSTLLMWHCPACDTSHGVHVKRAPGEEGPVWTWNNDIHNPTIQPSVRVSGTRPLTEDEYQRVIRGEKVETVDTTCHFHIIDGKIAFCGDCTHALNGKTIDMVED
mgnify:FL=1